MELPREFSGMDQPRTYAARHLLVEAQQYDADKAHRLHEPFRSALCSCEEISGRGDSYKGRHLHRAFFAHGEVEFVRDADWLVRVPSGAFLVFSPAEFAIAFKPASDSKG